MESEISMIKTSTEEEGHRPEISRPIATATADHIYRRPLRPSALLRSPPPPSAIVSLKKKKLEDYLDSVLLAEISSKINRAKKAKDLGSESNWRKSEESSSVVDLRDNLDPPMFDDQFCSSTAPFQQFQGCNEPNLGSGITGLFVNQESKRPSPIDSSERAIHHQR